MSPVRFGVLRLVLAFLACFGAATAPAQTASCLPAQAPSYVEPRLRDAESVIVYVHGLHGDPRGTWTHEPSLLQSGSPVAWPCIVREDSLFEGINVYLAAYDSVLFGRNPDTTEAARLLGRDLQTSGVFAHAKVTLVAHSMGGLVLARMLTTPGLLSPQELRRVRLVVFVGTPALPTEAATMCSRLGLNRQCEEMQSPKAMDALWKAWDAAPGRPKAVCLAEGRDMYFLGLPPWLRIVPAASAHRPCRSGEIRAEVDLDHVDVAKPRSQSQRPHRDLRNAYEACVQPARPRPTPSTEQVQDEDAARFWVNDMVDSLIRLPEAQRPAVLEQRLAMPDVNRFWFPPDRIELGFDLEAYEQLNARSFALAASTQAWLLQSDVQWVRPVGQVADQLGDSALRMLTDRMADAGGLRVTDLLVALKPRGQPPGAHLHLLLVRRMTGRPDGTAMLGAAVAPLPPARCGA